MYREGGGGGGGKPVDDESEGKGAFRSLGRTGATKTAVRSARAAVLRQNQKASASVCTSFCPRHVTGVRRPSSTGAAQHSLL